MLFSLSCGLCMKGEPLSTLKGNNSCKTYNIRIKVRNVLKVYCITPKYDVCLIV